MPYNEKIHRIELAPEFRKALEERNAVCQPYFYTLYGYRFATMDKLPADIEADLRHHAAVIQTTSFLTDAEKAKRFSDIFNQAVGMASVRRNVEAMRELKPLRIEPLEERPYTPPVKYIPKPMRFEDVLRRFHDELEKIKLPPLVPEPWIPESLRTTVKPEYHCEGILAQVRDMQPLTPDDAIELKRPKKHKTIIQL